jgi:hypothetical protein
VQKFVIGALLIAVATARFVVASDAEAIDPRFDGRWIGVETFRHTSGYEAWAGQTPQVTAVIIIAKSGTMVGVVAGFAPGRYLISPKSKGNTIMFNSERRRAKLVLSPDGNTMKEDGAATIAVQHFGNAAPNFGNLLCNVSATFRRVGK